MKNSKLTHRLLNTGFILIAISLITLILSSLDRNTSSNFLDNSGDFFINYIIASLYFLCILISNRPFFKFKQIDKRLIIILLILFSINCFTLNNTITLFAEFTLWTKLYLILFYSAFLGIIYIDNMPKILKHFVFFFLGAGIIMTIYFAAYLAPIYHIATIGLIFFGLTIHLFIPLLVTIATIIIFIKLQKSKTDKAFFYAGIFIPMAITLAFLFQWNNLKTEIHEASSSKLSRPDNNLPEWVLLCQDMPIDPFSQKIIAGSMIFDTFENMFRGNWNNQIFDEVKKHDPLVNVGIGLLGDLDLSFKSRVQILKSQFNARHFTQRKLWSGRDLGTIEVLNNIQVFPDYRLAYSEKTITVKNFNQRGNNQQEAAFTFYLPEGSVATSLSLWIDGKEEKSRLTTKSKADSAYSTIVGIERRDPALLHWQEGNTLTVTVFPCTPKENRKFKIGITTPLQKEADILKLESVYFDGPISHNIFETSQIVFESDNEIQNIELPSGFKKKEAHTYTYTGAFKPYWEVSCKTTNLSKNKFCFNNNAYEVTDIYKQLYTFSPEYVYLDLNKSWTKSEYNRILKLFSDKDIYVHHDKLIKLNNENQSKIFDITQKKNFSLFPFNQISDWNNSLVISKSTELSPNLSDLEGSIFLKELIEKINSNEKQVNLFQIGKISSPYLKSLKEFQIINFHSGSLSELSQIIKERHFYQYNADASKINLSIADISIVKNKSNDQSTAPDHLLRLFAYNRIMKQMGRNYFNKDKDYINDLIEIANEAYIVSPISSLIVLETKKDYDKFDIPENENSLKNASNKSSGAVPEPGEWVLIILFIGVLTFVFFNKRKRLSTK